MAAMDLLQRIDDGIKSRKLLPPGRKILVAVSGGVDSMVLLHALHGLAKKNRWRLAVAHFNHQLRGRASDADEKLVRETAQRLKLQFFSDRADVKQFSERAKLSLETAARKLRHEFLAATATRQKISLITLAHHADDQVELFFLRLFRGAGGSGLAGMKTISPSPVDRSISLVRPLLDFSKTEILAHARQNKIRFREDASNFSNDHLRNRVRNELLPLLRKKYQPGVGGTVLRLMNIAGAEAELAEEMARGWQAYPRVPFHDLPVSLQRRVLQSQLADIGVASDFDLVEQLRTRPGAPISVGSGFAVSRTAIGRVDLQREALPEFNLAEQRLELTGRSGQGAVAGVKLRWQIKPGSLPRQFVHTPGLEVFDADIVGPKITVRHWRPGDRFQPIGLKSAAKLQDLFVNAKVSAARRRELLLAATASGEIFWVEGLRIGERFKLTAATRRQLHWRWEHPVLNCE